MKYYNNKARQAGMTLIELTVVLLVLIGLAGLMIPYVSGFVSKTHDSTGSANLLEANNAITRYETETGIYADDLESLIETGTTNVYTDIMNPGLFAASTIDSAAFTPADLATDAPFIRYASLNKAGIKTMYDMTLGATNGSATFQSANAQIDLTTAAVNNIAIVAAGGEGSPAAAMEEAFGRVFDTTCYDYVAFGIGSNADLIGRTMQDAPVHFSGNQADAGPDDKYNRFIAVFQVDKDNRTNGCSASTERARFVGSAMAMGQPHLFGLNHSLQHSYENLNNDLSNN